MKRLSPLALLAAILCAFIVSAVVAHAGETLSGKIVGIADGDTAKLLAPEKRQVKIRLEGIDAPEAGQEYGQNSKQAQSALIFGNEEPTATAALLGGSVWAERMPIVRWSARVGPGTSNNTITRKTLPLSNQRRRLRSAACGLRRTPQCLRGNTGSRSEA